MKYFYYTLCLVSCLFVYSSCKTVEYDMASIQGDSPTYSFLGNGSVNFLKSLKIKKSDSDSIIYDSRLEDALSGLNDPYLQIFFSSCTIGVSEVSVCVATLYFSEQTDNTAIKTNAITSFYQDATSSLKNGDSKTYTLYYYIAELQSVPVGQARVYASWSEDNEAQINSEITNLCQGQFKSSCELQVSPTGEIQHLTVFNKN